MPTAKYIVIGKKRKYIYMYMYRDISRNFASVTVISLSKRAYVEVDC